jgi:methyltransferase (TIGR00027 family)
MYAHLVGMCDDNLAIDLLPLFPHQLYALSFVLLGGALGKYSISRFLSGRTNCGDQAIYDNSDMDQIVILGAGNDTKLHRIKNLPNSLFEVDAKKTQKEKQKRLFHPNPLVKFIPVNFETESWLEKLEKMGFDKTKKTLFIWEGVTYYLTEQAIRATLKSISQCAPGSKVFLDYGDFKTGIWYTLTLQFLKFIGEPFHSTFDEVAITKLLGEYQLIIDEKPVSAELYPRVNSKAYYSDKINKGVEPTGLMCLVICTVS